MTFSLGAYSMDESGPIQFDSFGVSRRRRRYASDTAGPPVLLDQVGAVSVPIAIGIYLLVHGIHEFVGFVVPVYSGRLLNCGG